MYPSKLVNSNGSKLIIYQPKVLNWQFFVNSLRHDHSLIKDPNLLQLVNYFLVKLNLEQIKKRRSEYKEIWEIQDIGGRFF